MIERIQNSKMQVNYLGAFLAYIVLALTAVIYLPRCESKSDAFIFGFLIYSIYETTNYTTFKDWDPKIAIADSLWGGTLFALVYYFAVEI